MKRHAEIADNFRKSREWATSHTVLEFLGMAFDDMVAQRDTAAARAYKAEHEMRSMCRDQAAQITRYTEAEALRPSPSNPMTWGLVLKPILHTVHMSSAHPSKWDWKAREVVITTAANTLAQMLMEAAMNAPETEAEKDLPTELES